MILKLTTQKLSPLYQDQERDDQNDDHRHWTLLMLQAKCSQYTKYDKPDVSHGHHPKSRQAKSPDPKAGGRLL